MFQTLKTDVILLRLFLGLRPLIRENVSSLWQPATVKKKKTKKITIPSIFSTGDCGCVCKPVCVCVSQQFPVMSLWQRTTLRGNVQDRKISLRLQKVMASRVARRISVVWGKQDRKTEERWTFMLRKKKRGKTAADHWSKHSVISTTVPLIRRALPVTALRNTSA